MIFVFPGNIALSYLHLQSTTSSDNILNVQISLTTVETDHVHTDDALTLPVLSRRFFNKDSLSPCVFLGESYIPQGGGYAM